MPEKRLVFIHPISALGFRTQEIPGDLSLESRDCLSLYRAMKACARPEQQNDLVLLDPVAFFEQRSTHFFRQKDVLEYEAALKAKLQNWMSASGGDKPGSPAQRVIASLSAELQSASSDFWMSRNHRGEDLVKLLSDLHHQDDLVSASLLAVSLRSHFLRSRRYCSALIAIIAKPWQRASWRLWRRLRRYTARPVPYGNKRCRNGKGGRQAQNLVRRMLLVARRNPLGRAVMTKAVILNSNVVVRLRRPQASPIPRIPPLNLRSPRSKGTPEMNLLKILINSLGRV